MTLREILTKLKSCPTFGEEICEDCRYEIEVALSAIESLYKPKDNPGLREILEEKFGKEYLKDIHTGKSIDMTDEINDTISA